MQGGLVAFLLLSTFCVLSPHASAAAAASAGFDDSVSVYSDPFLDKDFQLIDSNELSDVFQLDNILDRELSAKPKIGFSGGPATGQQTVLLQNGSADAVLDLIFRPENGKSFEDYTITITTSDGQVLQPGDIQLVRIDNGNIEGVLYFNLTYTVAFDKLVGESEVSLTATDTETSTDFDTKVVDYRASGLSVYYFDGNNELVFVSGAQPGQGVSYNNYVNVIANPLPTMLARVQYINGTSSDDILLPEPAFDNLNVTVVNNRGLVYFLDNCSLTDNTFNGSRVELPWYCSFGFSAQPETGPYDGMDFGLNLNKYRSGGTTLVFDWDTFTDGTEFDGELYQNIIDIRVGQNVPVHIIDIQGDFDSLSRVGGDNITMTLINAENITYWFLEVDSRTSTPILDFLPPGGYQLIDSGSPFFEQTITLISTPGEGIDLDWLLRTTGAVNPGQNTSAIDLTNSTLSYDDTPYSLLTMVPNNGPAAGGTEVTLGGYFKGFNPARDSVRFSNFRIPSENIISYNADNIVFITVPQDEIGEGLAYEFDVDVTIERFTTGTLPYFYWAPLAIEIQVFGAFAVSGDRYSFDGCTDWTFQALLGPGIQGQDPNVTWELINPFGQNIACDVGVGCNEQVFTVPAANIIEVGVFYNVTASLTTRFNSSAVSDQVEVQKLDEGEKVGVFLYPVNPRSIRQPDVSLRFASLITIPACAAFTPSAMRYTWEVNGVTTTFLPANDTGVSYEQTGVTKIGREYNVAQTEVQYGFFQARLKAEFTDRPGSDGEDRVNYTISPAVPVAVVNTGAAQTIITGQEAFLVDGTTSFDPDAFVGSPANFQYAWTCQYSTDPNFATNPALSGTNCNSQDDLLPSNTASQFFLTTGVLQRNQEVISKYIRYTLAVTKSYTRFNFVTGQTIDDQISSPGTTYVVELLPSDNRDVVASVEGIIILNNLSKEVVPNQVEYFSDVIVSPSAPAGTLWTYEFVSPEEARGILLDRNNLNTDPGYYDPSTVPETDLPLGLRGFVLQPNTEYVLEIRFITQTATIEQVQRMSFTTVQEPVITALTVSGGTVENGFVVGNATTSFLANAQTPFVSSRLKTYFFAVNTATGTGVCLSGCNGENPAAFTISTQGTHSLVALIFDAQGVALLDQYMYELNFSITEGVQDLGIEETQRMITANFELGDDGNYVGVLNSMLVSINGAGQAQDSIVAGDVARYLNLVRGSVINSQLGVQYMAVANQFALQVANGATFTQEEFMDILNLPRMIVINTPTTERLQVAGLMPLFYNLTAGSALDIDATGTTRRRLLQSSINNVLLDYVESQKNAIIVSNTRDQACGFVTSTSTHLVGGIDFGLIPFGYRLGVICNAGQQEAIGDFQVNNQDVPSGINGQFQYCDIYNGRDVTKQVVLTTMPDYVYTSGVQGNNQTSTKGIALSGVGEVQNNVFVLDSRIESGCYVTTLELDTTKVNITSVAAGFSYTDFKVWGVDATEYENYGRDFNGILSSVNSEKSQVIIASPRVGQFATALGQGIVPTVAPEPPQDRDAVLSGGQIAGIVIGILLFILLGLLVAWFIVQRCCYAPVAAIPPSDVPPTYIERDVYGRMTIMGEEGYEEQAFDDEYAQEMAADK